MRFSFFYTALLFSVNLTGQNIRSIAIIHGGDELKPVGTLIISMGAKIMPNERPFIDSVFGRGIQTDERTFFFLEEYFRKNRLLIDNAEKLRDSREFYTFKLSDGFKLYLGVLDFASFFNNLRRRLTRNHFGREVLKALKYY